MPFIGDQGWFYLSARDLLLTGKIPLVSITSSHTWLHQGPIWTYMLAVALWISHFNPVSGAILTGVIGLVTILLIYKIGSEMFSQRVGLIAALFYATSPYIVFSGRFAYHTSPIPLLALLLLYVTYKWIKGFQYGFPLILFFLALLYNFELATFVIIPVFLVVLIYGIVKKTKWVKNILQPKIILLSFLALIIPMLPMVLYDIYHGYPQTIKFAIWILYKIATIVGFPHLHPNAPSETFKTMLPFVSVLLQRIIFLGSALFSWIILLVATLNLFLLNKPFFKKREYLQSYSLLLLFFIIPTLGYIAEKTNSEAYLLVFFPSISFIIGLLFDRFMKYHLLKIPSIVILMLFVSINIFLFFKMNFFMDNFGYGPTLTERIAIAKQIIQKSKGQEYNLIGRGPWSQYESFTMNYQYLAWWLGHEPSKRKAKLVFIVQEKNGHAFVIKRIRNI